MKYKGKEVRFIKDYGSWILVEHKEGFKEGIHKHDLGLIKERVRPAQNLKVERVSIFSGRRNERICD